MRRNPFMLAVLLVLSLTLAACSPLDVIGNQSITSLEQVLKAIPDKTSADEAYGGWAVTAPDGSVRFIWCKDFSKSKDYDVLMEINAEPFIDAGLDMAMLPAGMAAGDKIIVGTDLGDEGIRDDQEDTPIGAYAGLVTLSPEAVQYHAAMDHFGVNLANGHAFEWAKDMTANDKDIVFVLDPKVFMDAGVDPEKVEGWVFARVEAMDKSGRIVEVEKLLKPFNLE